MKERKLTPKQDRFVTEYLATGNASEAYRRAYDCSRMLPATINNNAWTLIKRSDISARINELRENASNTATLDRAGFINLLTEIATADASSLANVEIRPCRHCWGIDHQYQWRTPKEYAYHVGKVADMNAKRRAAWEERVDQGKREKEPKDDPLPTDEGGYGYVNDAKPNPDCPECGGDGIEKTIFADTRKLKGAAKRLYAGVKRTKDGLEIKTSSQEHARGLLAKLHGIDQPGTTNVQVNASAPGGTVQAAVVVMPADPLAAASAYQDLMKGN